MLCGFHQFGNLWQGLFHITQNFNVHFYILLISAVNIPEMNDFAHLLVFKSPVTRSSKRMPMAINTSHSLVLMFLVADVAIIPSIPQLRGWSDGMADRPSMVEPERNNREKTQFVWLNPAGLSAPYLDHPSIAGCWGCMATSLATSKPTNTILNCMTV